MQRPPAEWNRAHLKPSDVYKQRVIIQTPICASIRHFFLELSLNLEQVSVPPFGSGVRIRRSYGPTLFADVAEKILVMGVEIN